jgi:hypothetical protein
MDFDSKIELGWLLYILKPINICKILVVESSRVRGWSWPILFCSICIISTFWVVLFKKEIAVINYATHASIVNSNSLNGLSKRQKLTKVIHVIVIKCLTSHLIDSYTKIINTIHIQYINRYLREIKKNPLYCMYTRAQKWPNLIDIMKIS